MRSITLKIVLVLVVVSLVGALFTTFYLQNRTKKAFDNFIRDQDELFLINVLEDHYQQYQSWENVDQVFRGIYSINMGGNQHRGMGMDPQKHPSNLGPPFLLASPFGVVITAGPNSGGIRPGDILPQEELERGIPLEVEGDLTGYLVAVPFPKNRSITQQDFLGTVQEGLLISTLVTLLIALVLGGILILSFTRPIRKLVNGTIKVAGGDLGYQVNIRSADELGQLADSFNNMSRDLAVADQSRKQMTADIAHDLRTPLSILHGYTEAMSEGKLDGNAEIYQVLHQQTQHLNYLIDDLRTLSLLDSEELNFQIQNIDPGLILTNTHSAFLPIANEKDILLSLDITSDLPRINLDPDRLTQILGNLVNNAFAVLTEGGKIQLSAGQETENIYLEVSDNGPGIAVEDLPRIFDRHFRPDKSRLQDHGSSGLGLAITKKLVEAQGGTIEVQSQLDHGTAFKIVFPVS
jgi:signal transduction histidine kinase